MKGNTAVFWPERLQAVHSQRTVSLKLRHNTQLAVRGAWCHSRCQVPLIWGSLLLQERQYLVESDLTLISVVHSLYKRNFFRCPFDFGILYFSLLAEVTQHLAGCGTCWFTCWCTATISWLLPESGGMRTPWTLLFRGFRAAQSHNGRFKGPFYSPLYILSFGVDRELEIYDKYYCIK